MQLQRWCTGGGRGGGGGGGRYKAGSREALQAAAMTDAINAAGSAASAGEGDGSRTGGGGGGDGDADVALDHLGR